MAITIYHNPRCSKSRKTLQLITEAGVTPDIIEYLKTPPDASEIVISATGDDERFRPYDRSRDAEERLLEDYEGGGAFKPRTSPYSFQGLGEEALQLLARAREEIRQRELRQRELEAPGDRVTVDRADDRAPQRSLAAEQGPLVRVPLGRLVSKEENVLASVAHSRFSDWVSTSR